MNRTLHTLLSTQVALVTRSQLSRLLDDVADTHPREAEKRRQCAHAMYRWAVAKGFAAENPLSGSPTYGTGEPKDRVLSTEEIRTFWHWLDAGANAMPPDVNTVLRLQLLIGARVGEIAGMAGDELSLNGETVIWTLPPARSKNKRERVTPIVGTANVLITAALKDRPQGVLFRKTDGERALSSTDVGQALLNRDLPIPHFTTHDLRRTVVSGMDELGITLDTIAAVVGHQRGTAATQTLVRHYSRPKLDGRKESALLAWDRHIWATIWRDAADDNVERLAN